MTHLFRKLMAVTLCAAMVLSAGCSGGGASGTPSQPAGDGENAGKKDEIRVAVAQDAETFSPFRTSSTTAQMVMTAIYEKLFIMTPDRKIEPGLVESYEHTSDLVWDFKLKEGVLFHNGEEMTAEDVKASLDLSRESHPSITTPKTVEVTGTYTFRITTETVNMFLISEELSKKWCYIVPKSMIDAKADFNTEPIGSGPYRFLEQATSEYIKLESFDQYRSDPITDGRVQKITFKVIPEPSARTIALENGEVDLINEVENMDIQRLIDNPNTEVQEFSGIRVYNITLNCESPNLSNVLVRKAIAYAINPESAMAVGINGMGVVTRGTLVEGVTGYSDKGIPVYDPEQAKKFLEEAGVKPGEITFDCLAYKANYTSIAESIQSDLKEVGINMTISNVEDAVFLEKTANGNFDAIILGQPRWEEPYGLYKSIYHSDGIGASNRCRLRSETVDKIIDELPFTTDEQKSEEMYREATEEIQNSYVVLPLFLDSAYAAFAKGLGEVYMDIDGRYYFERMRY